MAAADRLIAEAAEKLKETVRRGLTLDAGQVKVIGLEHIRKAAGATWPQVADRIRANSLSFIEGCLRDGDIVIPCGDGFLIIYATGAERDLASECTTVQEALNAFYLGQDGLQMLRAEVSARKVRASEMARLLAPEPETKTAAHDGARGIIFVPSWNAEREIIGLHIAMPTETAGGATRFGYDKAYRATGKHDVNDFVQTDLDMLDRVAALVARHGDRRGLLCFSVHASTMSRRTARGAFLARLMGIPEPQRRLMIGRIAEIETGTPVITIADWVHQLRAYVSRVVLELHPRENMTIDLETVGAWCIETVLPESMQTPAQRNRHDVMIQRRATQARRQNLKCAILGLTDPHLIKTAMSAGTDFYSSERLWPANPEPLGVYPYKRSQLERALNAAQANPAPPTLLSTDERSPAAAAQKARRDAPAGRTLPRV